MDAFRARKLKFKAWNLQTRLMMRLHSIDCIKGELVKEDHILLQFTGHVDEQDEEIYEQDILLAGGERYLVSWDHDRGWVYCPLSDETRTVALLGVDAGRMRRLCSRFEIHP